ncbi:hypothetical protein L8X40_08445, partial [Campylobacter sp. CNRCH_2013_0855]
MQDGVILGENSGIKIQSGVINTLENNGIVRGEKNHGIEISHQGKVDNIINSGVIYGKLDGFNMISMWDYNRINKIENKNIFTGGRYGIYINQSSVINTLINSGIIFGGIDGIMVSSEWGRSGSIENIDNKGTIVGKHNGINVKFFSNNHSLIASINTITNKGTILGQSGAGVFINGSNQHIKDYIKLEGSNALIAGGTAGIY